MRKPLDVLLDLDGTLIDPKPGILGSVKHALRMMGAVPPPVDDLHWAIGPPLRSTFARLLGPEHAEAAVAHYRQEYRSGAMYACEVYPGIAQALAKLSASGHRLFIVTAKPHVFARPIAERMGFTAHVRAVYGPELDGTRDDKAELLAHALDCEGIRPDEAVMVGDRQFDMLAAAANGVASIGVTWGYGSADELRTSGAVHLCPDPVQLPALVQEVAAGLARQ